MQIRAKNSPEVKITACRAQKQVCAKHTFGEEFRKEKASCCGLFFQWQGLRGLIRVEEKLNAPKYWYSLNENPIQSIQNLRLGRRFTFQQDNEPARVAWRQICECPWVAQPQPGIKPSQMFLEKHGNVHLPPSNLTELERWRGEEKIGR